MKKWMVIAVLTASAIGSAHAGGAGLFGAHWAPKDYGSTMGGGLILRMDMDPSSWLDLRFGYYGFDDSSKKLTLMPLEAALLLKMSMDPKVTPYLGIGGGYYFAEGEDRVDGRTVDLDYKDRTALMALGGIQVMFSRNLQIFAEAQYAWLEFKRATVRDADSPLDGQSIDRREKLEGLRINIGLMMRL